MMNVAKHSVTKEEYQNRIEENIFKKKKAFDRFLNYPYAVDAEMNLLNGIFKSLIKFEDVVSEIKSDDFFDDKHIIIFSIMEELHQEGIKIDVINLNDKLKAKHKLMDAGGQKYLLEIGRQGFVGSYQKLILIILEKSLIRKLIGIYSTNFYLLRDGANVVDVIEKSIAEIRDLNYKSEISKPDTDATEFIKELERRQNTDELRYFPTGITDLDNKIIGFGLGNLNIIGAKPGAGKTAFLTQCAYNQAVKGNIPTCIISIEMQKYQIFSRLIAMVKGVNVNSLSKGEITEKEKQEAEDYLFEHSKSPLYIEEKNIVYVEDIVQKIKSHKKINGVKNFYIDHHYAIGTRKYFRTKNDSIPYVVGLLTQTAKEEDVAINLLSQFNKDSKNRRNKTPVKDDLMGSAQIEQDAYLIILIDRPESDGRKQFADKTDATNLAKFLVVKNRNGILGEVKVYFRGDRFKFENLKEEYNNYDDYVPF